MEIANIVLFQKSLIEVFGIQINGKRDLLPSTLFSKIMEKGINISWEKVLKWDLFEYGDEDWDFNVFLSLIKSNDRDKLQIVSDGSYQKNEALVFSSLDIETFENVYGDRYDEEFFQPSDYLIIKNDEELILLHHEGYICFYSPQSSSSRRSVN